MFNKVSSHVDKIIKTQFKRPKVTKPTPKPRKDTVEECLMELGCSGNFCHQDCLRNPTKRKCLPLMNVNGWGRGVCVECYTDKHCASPGRTKCDKSVKYVDDGERWRKRSASYTCTKGSIVKPYMQLKEANEAIFKPMQSNGDKLTNAQTSGASIAQLFSNTR